MFNAIFFVSNETFPFLKFSFVFTKHPSPFQSQFGFQRHICRLLLKHYIDIYIFALASSSRFQFVVNILGYSFCWHPTFCFQTINASSFRLSFFYLKRTFAMVFLVCLLHMNSLIIFHMYTIKAIKNSLILTYIPLNIQGHFCLHITCSDIGVSYHSFNKY